MHNQRGFVPPAIIVSTIALILCSIAWGALGVLSLVEPAMPLLFHRYLCSLLATLTICSGMVHLTARIIRTIRYAHGLDAAGDGDSYANGYADGLDARPVSPGVSRLVPLRR